MSSFVLCKPFTPADDINSLDPLLSCWLNVERALSSQSVALYYLANIPHNFDITLTAHHALVWKNRAYMSYNKQAVCHASPFMEAWLKYHGFSVLDPVLSKDDKMPLSFAGSADCVVVDNTIYLGYGIQTDHHIANVLPSLFNTQVVDLALTDARLPHLVDCFLPLPCGRALFCAQAFDPISQRKLASDFSLIPVSENDARLGICSSIVLGDTIITPTGCEVPV